MDKNRLLVTCVTIGALAILVIALMGGGWGHTGMGPSWPISPMGGTMYVGLGEILILLAGTVFLVALALWVVRSLKK